MFAAVLTSFLIDSLQNLQPDPAQQSVYYQQQSVAMLAQISQQIASVVPQVPVPSTPPPPFPEFHPSASNIRVNAYWLVGLVCSLSAALFATLVQHWVRSYMEVFRRYDHPLKRARFRQFFFEGTSSIRAIAAAVPLLIRISLLLFFLGLSDSLLSFNKIIGVITIVPICCCCGFFLVYGMLAPLQNLQSPHQSPISLLIFFLMKTFLRPNLSNRSLSKNLPSMSLEACQEWLVMEDADGRKGRDARSIRWLISNNAVRAEMESLVLAIPGSFNTEWGRDVWIEVSSQARETLESTSPSPAGSQVSLIPQSPHPLEGTTVGTISRCVRNLFDTCNNRPSFPYEEARHMRMRACVEAVASLVCCINLPLNWFGEVGKLVSEIGHIDNINQSPSTNSEPSFVIRWTCLSIVAVQRMLRSNRLQVLAGYAVNGLARFQSDYGHTDEAGWRSAQKIEICLKTAWEHVEDLHRAFEPWAQKRTREEVEEILQNHERQISELERIKVEADDLEVVDWRIFLYQDAMDAATYRLTRQLPGVSFDEPRRSGSFLINDTFNIPATGSAPVTPQLIFPGQQVQALTSLGLKLREVLDGNVEEGYVEVLESLKPVDQIPISLRRPTGLMKRQLWRLQDIRDGSGLGFTVELFFLSLRELLSMPSLHESNKVFYTSTFKIITSHWERSKESLGTQRILLNIICDLTIRDRGLFSNCSYPKSTTTMLLDMVGNILQGYAGPDDHIRDAVLEIENVDSRNCMDTKLWRSAFTLLQSRFRNSVSQRHVLSSLYSIESQET